MGDKDLFPVELRIGHLGVQAVQRLNADPKYTQIFTSYIRKDIAERQLAELREAAIDVLSELASIKNSRLASVGSIHNAYDVGPRNRKRIDALYDKLQSALEGSDNETA